MIRTIATALGGLLLAYVAGVGGPGLSVDAPVPPARRVGSAPEQARLVHLVVLGDSYASAAVPFDRGTLVVLGSPSVCARGPAWPRLLDPVSIRLSLTHVSCSGAVVSDLIDRRMRAGEPIQAQALNETTDLVMLGIGGNDTGFSELFSACRFEPSDRCRAVADRLAPRIDGLGGSLVRLYREVLGAAPNALVVVVLYADSLPSAGDVGLDGCSALRAAGDELSDADLLILDEWGSAIGAQVRRAIETVADPRVRVADLADAFAGHRICSAEPWQWGRDGEIPFHPNAAGHAALAARLSRFLDELEAEGAIPGRR